MSEPQATSFHGDQSGARDKARAPAEDPEVVAAIREVERLLRERRHPGVAVYRVGPNVLGQRPIRSR